MARGTEPHVEDLLARITDLVTEASASGGVWPLAVTCGVMFLQAFMLPVPASAVTIAACALAGPLPGAVAAWSGAVCGAAASFLVFRGLGDRIAFLGRVRRLLGKAGNACDSRGFTAVFLARAAPCVPFGAVSVACGLSDMRFGTYITATALGKIFPTALYAWIGADPLVLGVAGAVALMAFLLHLFFRRRHRSDRG